MKVDCLRGQNIIVAVTDGLVEDIETGEYAVKLTIIIITKEDYIQIKKLAKILGWEEEENDLGGV